MPFDSFGKWQPFKPQKAKRECILWHQEEDTNWKVAGLAAYRNLRIEAYKKGDPIPERHSAYAYQIGWGWYTPHGYWDDNGGKWEIEVDSLGPMVYFGMPVEKEGIRYCEDDHGTLHALEPGDTIEPVMKGEITVTHYPPKSK